MFVEGNYKRALAGSTDDPFLKTLGQGAPTSPAGRGGGLWPLRGLLADWGGVLTTDLFASFADFAEEEGLDTERVRGLFRHDRDARGLLVDLETGAIGEEVSEPGSRRRSGSPRTQA